MLLDRCAAHAAADRDAALVQLDAAAVAHERMGALPLQARSRHHYALALQARVVLKNNEAERALTDEVGTRDHQGVVARVRPYRYADAYELAGVERPLLVCLDQVTDPHNLGALARSAAPALSGLESGRFVVTTIDRRSCQRSLTME